MGYGDVLAVVTSILLLGVVAGVIYVIYTVSKETYDTSDTSAQYVMATIGNVTLRTSDPFTINSDGKMIPVNGGQNVPKLTLKDVWTVDSGDVLIDGFPNEKYTWKKFIYAPNYPPAYAISEINRIIINLPLYKNTIRSLQMTMPTAVLDICHSI